MQRYYGIDLLDFWRGNITYRQLLVYVYHMPVESRTSSLLSEKPELQEWGLTQYLLGFIADRLADLNFAYAQVHTEEKQRNKLRPPESVLPDSAIEKTVREETKHMSISEFFSPADLFADLATKRQD